ncbi:MAG: hypothetical protein GX591_04380 [Planctomycetes bacterium]|nr:hypothetical protein [Planctomycetota bacterium]
MSSAEVPVELHIEPAYAQTLGAAGLTTYEAFMTTTMGEPLVKPGLQEQGRQRRRLTLGDETFYLKRYTSSSSLPGARLEVLAVRSVRDAGVPTMSLAATGLGPQGGFNLVTEVPGDALSRRFDELVGRFGGGPAAGGELARRLGGLAGKLHRAGLVHRDLYASHIFVDVRGGELDLYLIDLARVFRPRRRCWRWRLKDLAALKYSLPADWAARHWPAVRDAYEDTLGRRLPFWAAVVIAIRTRQTARHDRRRLGRLAREPGG